MPHCWKSHVAAHINVVVKRTNVWAPFTPWYKQVWHKSLRNIVCVNSLLVVTLIVGVCNCSMFCCALLCVHSSFAIISMGKRESWLLCFVCFTGVSWLLCGSSSRCHGFVCSLWLWYFLIILTIFKPDQACFVDYKTTTNKEPYLSKFFCWKFRWIFYWYSAILMIKHYFSMQIGLPGPLEDVENLQHDGIALGFNP